MKILLEDLSSDFPMIDQDETGYKNRYAYLTYFSDEIPEEKNGVYSQFFEGVYKYDLQEEKLVKKIKFGQNKTGGEVFFQKKDPEFAKSEDDGYLMSFVYDWVTNKSSFMMWDAKTMDEIPVTEAEIKTRVPNGFHTAFVQEANL